jgi:lipopolysaccharide export system protein LptA
MNYRYRFAWLVSLLFVLLSMGCWISAAVAGNEPILIESDHMTSTEKTNSVVFSGNVDAKQGDVQIRTDKMTVYYTPKDQAEANTSAGASSQQVEKLVCVGNVEITRDEFLGTAKKMIYLEKKQQVILTENAKAWQDQNMVSGEKIVYYLDEKRSEVFGGRTSTTVAGDTEAKKPDRVKMTIRQE